MFKLCVASLLLSLAFVSGTALAHDAHGSRIVVVETPPRPVLVEPQVQPRGPSVFRNGYRGLLTGGLVGLSAGYLAARHGHDDAFRTVALGTGIGAVSGAALGIGLGLVDLAGDTPGRAHLVLRDTLYGTAFGAITGVIVGSLFIMRTGDPEHAAFGTAIGALSGAGLGLAIGMIDSLRVFERRRYVPVVGATTDRSGGLVVTPGVAGRF
jgi:hypothetical protein